MSEILKKWLKPKLDSLMSVQKTVIGSEPGLVTHLWSGVKINIYIIDEPVKTRAIKRALQEATNVGIGSMFIVAAHLLPTKGIQFIPEEWLQAIHILSGEQLYSYQFGKEGPELTQLHLEPLGGLGKWEVQQGPAFNFNRLRFYSLSTKTRFIKGTWMVADFDSPAFWKDNDYRRHQEKERQQRHRATGNTHWHTWEGFQTWNSENRTNGNGNSQSATSSPLKSYLDQCYDFLGVKSDAGFDEVRAAYRKIARQVHPDVSELPKEEAEVRFRIVTQAYEYIKSANNWA
ncbi:MAG: J domain-containing protein [Aggregatilineales bacterium]